MSTVTVQDFRRDPSGILDRVEAGESILVSDGDRFVAEMRPVSTPQSALRPFGLAAGEFVVPADFDEPLPDDVIRAFDGQ